jgi:hypothetical protein
MGHGLEPSPYDGPDPADPIDEGTLHRIGSPTPAPIGLDSKSPGTAKGSAPSMADRIIGYPKRNFGQKVGDGECFTLADRALAGAGAKSAADFGTVAPDIDYVWGTPVSLADVRPGDIVQFRDYRFDREVVTKKTGETVTDTDFQERTPHHTAIVERVDGGGAFTVLEQNVDSSPVVRNQLFFKDSGPTTVGNTTTTIKVSGKFWFYRPQPR